MNPTTGKRLLAIGVALMSATMIGPLYPASRNQSPVISLAPDGRLTYTVDEQGNRILDFSHCGYAGGDHAIPDAPVRIVVGPQSGDSTARIQHALDYVATLPGDSNGLRGAVLLLQGRHELLGGLRITNFGVVLRGQGMSETGTVLIAAGLDRRTLITVAGRPGQTAEQNPDWAITDIFVPVGATTLHVRRTAGLRAGSSIRVIRPSSAAWIEQLSASEFGGGVGGGWKPGTRDIVWERVVQSIDGTTLTLDAPLTTAMTSSWAEATWNSSRRLLASPRSASKISGSNPPSTPPTPKTKTIPDHNYGLWYDRRRDDHERVRRMDGDVWPPFFEQPFARSGQGTAWDGLSQFDLTKFNPWYWSRLREFADIAGERGLVLFHQNYSQHNLLEAGAHWADSPWRSTNNINQAGFPEPPPYAGDKRIFMAELFYDLTHPARRELHRRYIRQCLDNFAGQANVIQFTSAEFTGPQHFVEFWLDTIAEWERERSSRRKEALTESPIANESEPPHLNCDNTANCPLRHQRRPGRHPRRRETGRRRGRD